MSATPPKANDELGLTEKVGYGAGDFASNLYCQFFNLFLNFLMHVMAINYNSFKRIAI